MTDISTYLRILDEIRITDQERETSNLQVQDGQLRWQLPAADFGTREIQFEDEETRRLAQLLENWPKVTIRDEVWIERVVSDLKSERPVSAEGVHRNVRRRG